MGNARSACKTYVRPGPIEWKRARAYRQQSGAIAFTKERKAANIVGDGARAGPRQHIVEPSENLFCGT